MALLILPACTPGLAGDVGLTRRARVVVDVTSGVPPPEWTMTPAETDEFQRRLTALMPAAPVSLYDGL